MTLVTNAFTTFSQIGRREDLSDFIYNIAPTMCPLQDKLPRATASQTKHEWQTDSLAAPSNNKVLEGDTAAGEAASPTVRLDNVCQISAHYPSVTRTAEIVNKAGRTSEFKYQVRKRSLELKRDIEVVIASNKAKATGNSTTQPELAGIEAWFTTNVSRGSGGTSGSGTGSTAATNGTQRVFTESLCLDVLTNIYNSGGDPDCIMVGPAHKRQFSDFTGNATRMINATEQELNRAIFVYRSDFGDLQVMTNRFLQGNTLVSGGAGIRSALILQTDMWGVAFLDEPKIEMLGTVGLAKQAQIWAQYTLEARNEAASGIVADLS